MRPVPVPELRSSLIVDLRRERNNPRICTCVTVAPVGYASWGSPDLAETPMTETHIPAQRQPVADPSALSTVELDGPPPGLWDRMRADPQYAPEHLALEA